MPPPTGVPRDPDQPNRTLRALSRLQEILSSLQRRGFLSMVAGSLGEWQLTAAGGAAFGAVAVGAAVKRTTSQTIPDATTTALSFDTEVRDDAAFWAVGSPTKLVIPSTGWYLFTAHLKYNSNSTNKRVMDFRFDGATFPGASISWPGSGQDQDMALCLAFYMTAAQYVEVTTFQNSGGNLDVTAAEAQAVKL